MLLDELCFKALVCIKMLDMIDSYRITSAQSFHRAFHGDILSENSVGLGTESLPRFQCVKEVLEGSEFIHHGTLLQR